MVGGGGAGGGGLLPCCLTFGEEAGSPFSTEVEKKIPSAYSTTTTALAWLLGKAGLEVCGLRPTETEVFAPVAASATGQPHCCAHTPLRDARQKTGYRYSLVFVSTPRISKRQLSNVAKTAAGSAALALLLKPGETERVKGHPIALGPKHTNSSEHRNVAKGCLSVFRHSQPIHNCRLKNGSLYVAHKQTRMI